MSWRDDRDDLDIDLGRGARASRGESPEHPGWGLASFLISIFAGIGLFIVGGIAVLVAALNEREFDDKDPETLLLGLGIIAALVASIIGLVLGFMSVTHSQRNLAFAVIGIAFNAIIVLGVLGLICFGMVA